MRPRPDRLAGKARRRCRQKACRGEVREVEDSRVERPESEVESGKATGETGRGVGGLLLTAVFPVQFQVVLPSLPFAWLMQLINQADELN